MSRFPDVTPLSQRGRLAVALQFFDAYCKNCGIKHPEIDAYLDKMWEFVGIFGDPEAFGRWTSASPALTEVGLGDHMPLEFVEMLKKAGVPEREFRAALELTTEVLYVSMYGAADEKNSRIFLQKLADIAAARGVEWPDIGPFALSRWIDGHGWGAIPSPHELSTWRAASCPRL